MEKRVRQSPSEEEPRAPSSPRILDYSSSKEVSLSKAAGRTEEKKARGKKSERRREKEGGRNSEFAGNRSKRRRESTNLRKGGKTDPQPSVAQGATTGPPCAFEVSMIKVSCNSH